MVETNTNPAEQFPKRCGACGELIERERWQTLPAPPKGSRQVGPGFELELRNHACGSTVAIVLRWEE